MKILSKEHLNLFKFPENKISNNQKVISGIKKGVTQAIILSTGVNSSNSKSFIDIRLWAMNDNTEKYVPTPKGLRLDIDQYAAFCTMLQDEFSTINESLPNMKIISIDSLLEDEDTVNPFKHTTT
tara:strand:- start:91 stop:465 length:375 start_codon:yes stop_codon:yes gene_type:complete